MSAPLSQQFQQAVVALKQRQFAQAFQLATNLNQAAPNNPDVLHILGLSLQHAQPLDALRYFDQSLAINSQQANVWLNRANVLQTTAQYRAAKHSYIKAIQCDAKLVDAWYNLATCHYKSHDYLAAIHALDKALELQPNGLKLYVLKARAAMDYRNFDVAEKTLHEALQRWPQEVSVIFNQALLLRAQERPQQAQQCLLRIKAQLDGAQWAFQMGCLAYDLSELEHAETYLQQAIQQQNDFIPAHQALAKLYWEHGRRDQYVATLRKAIEQQPESLALANSYLSHLYQAEQYTLAVEQADKFIQQFGEVHSLLHVKASVAARQNELDKAIGWLDKVLQQQPRYPRYLIDKAGLLIQKGNYEAALPLLELAHENDPLNQEIHAYKGLCWRLLGNYKQHDSLNNYQQYIKVGRLPTPEGFASFADFWQQLQQRIKSLHTTEHQPLDQSVRNGTQTVGSLLTLNDPIIQAYKASLQQFIDEYLAQLPEDPQHPVSARHTGSYHFSGSWSVKLFGQGFHTNHVHPQGWLSMCTYLSVPEQVRHDDPEQAGWIRFGQTSLNLGDREQVAKAVCPEPGMCVIFPSFSWHGTIPFDGEGERITIPCDIMPS